MPRIDRDFIGDIKPPEQGQVIYRDEELKGFGIRATRGSVSYIAERRIGGKVRRFTVGRCDRMSLEVAREEARRLLSGMAASTGAKTSTLSVTLEQVLEKYLASRKLRPNTMKHYNNVTRRCLKDWLDKPILSITRQMVTARHRELTRVTKQGTAGEIQANMAMRNLCTLINFALIHYGDLDDPPPDNPVKILSQSRAWHREPRRRSIIPDHKLAFLSELKWYADSQKRSSRYGHRSSRHRLPLASLHSRKHTAFSPKPSCIPRNSDRLGRRTRDTYDRLNQLISGTTSGSETVSLTAYDASLTGTSPVGQETAGYSASSGTSATTLASNLTTSINTVMSNIGVSATANGSVITIGTSPYNATAFSCSRTGNGATILLRTNSDNSVTASIGGVPRTGDVLSLTAYNPSLSGGQTTASYTVASGDTTSNIATGLSSAINSALSVIGVLASASGPTITMTMNATTFSSSPTGTTEVIELSNYSPTSNTAFIGTPDSPATGDTVSITAYDPSLTGTTPPGQETASYLVQSGDTTSNIATALATAINTTMSNISCTASASASAITLTHLSSTTFCVRSES